MRGADDLVSMVLDALDEASNIVAQSMGGLIAVRSALKAPDKIRRLVLTATSAGAPVEDLGGSNPPGLPERVSVGREMDHGNPAGPVERNSVDQGPHAFNLGR